jgi:hypothetical protein
MGTFFTKLIVFIHKVSFTFNMNAPFPPLRETLCGGRVKLFAEASDLFK